MAIQQNFRGFLNKSYTNGWRLRLHYFFSADPKGKTNINHQFEKLVNRNRQHQRSIDLVDRHQLNQELVNQQHQPMNRIGYQVYTIETPPFFFGHHHHATPIFLGVCTESVDEIFHPLHPLRLGNVQAVRQLDIQRSSPISPTEACRGTWGGPVGDVEKWGMVFF